jgi:hypothetical protein
VDDKGPVNVVAIRQSLGDALGRSCHVGTLVQVAALNEIGALDSGLVVRLLSDVVILGVVPEKGIVLTSPMGRRCQSGRVMTDVQVGRLLSDAARKGRVHAVLYLLGNSGSGPCLCRHPLREAML